MRLVRQDSSAPEMDMILVSRFPQQAKGTAFSTPKKKSNECAGFRNFINTTADS